MATVSELIIQRQKHLSESWQSFLNHPLHSSITQVIDRKNTNLPSNFVPWAPAIVIASNSLLKAARQAGYSERCVNIHVTVIIILPKSASKSVAGFGS